MILLSIYFSLLSWFSILSFFVFFGVTLVWIILNILKDFFKSGIILINFMWLMMILFFFTSSIWIFYILFEINMIPMVLILMGWGTNMARMNASIYMILYTMFFSLPVLYIILNNSKMVLSMDFRINNYEVSTFYKFILTMMFLVKIPIFGFHYWLPKAHVEASTIGSMILAAGLLKTGGLGLMKIILWMYFHINNSWFMMGAFLGALYCCFQSDQKKLIALSSVSHMSFSTASLFSSINIGSTSMILYGFTHSICSSLMFFNSGVISSLSKTRLLMYIPKFSLFVMILLILSIFMNLGLPPSFSFISELLSVTSIFYDSYLKMVLVFFMMIASLMFSSFYIIMMYQPLTFCQSLINLTVILTFFTHSIFILWWLIIYVSYN